MHYYIIIALQGFCIYHVYSNKKEHFWYFLILFIPLIGGLIYLITQVFNKKDINVIKDGITTYINPSKKITDLEEKLQYSETFQNRINLADAYFDFQDYDNAIIHYEEALKGNFKDDTHTLNKLVICYFKNKEFSKVIKYSEKINLDKNFRDSIFFYGLALEQKGFLEKAEIELLKVNKRYSNYSKRLEISDFYIRNEKKEKAKELIQEIISELKTLPKENYRKYKFIYTEAEQKLLKL